MIVNIPPIVIGVLFIFYDDVMALTYIYLTVRTGSIVFNVVAYLVIYIKIENMNFHRTSSEPALISQRTADAVNALATRLLYYSVVQTISRVGTTWYQMQYGIHDWDFALTDPTTFQVGLNYVQAVLTPSAGIGGCYLNTILCVTVVFPSLVFENMF